MVPASSGALITPAIPVLCDMLSSMVANWEPSKLKVFGLPVAVALQEGDVRLGEWCRSGSKRSAAGRSLGARLVADVKGTGWADLGSLAELPSGRPGKRDWQLARCDIKITACG